LIVTHGLELSLASESIAVCSVAAHGELVHNHRRTAGSTVTSHFWRGSSKLRTRIGLRDVGSRPRSLWDHLVGDRDPVANAALVIKTLVASGARAITDADALTLPSFLDLSSLCEADVLMDRIEAIASSDELPAFALTRTLKDAGILDELQPRLSRVDMRRVRQLLPDQVACSLLRDPAVRRPRRLLDERKSCNGVETPKRERTG
jgi:hypothetical protein